MNAHRVHEIQVFGGLVGTLTAGQKNDAGDRSRHGSAKRAYGDFSHLRRFGLFRAFFSGQDNLGL
jgi:hypothetical protein